MSEIRIPDRLYENYQRLSSELDGFDTPDEMIQYVLAETASELEANRSEPTEDRDDDDDVAQRLQDLGYIE